MVLALKQKVWAKFASWPVLSRDNYCIDLPLFCSSVQHSTTKKERKIEGGIAGQAHFSTMWQGRLFKEPPLKISGITKDLASRIHEAGKRKFVKYRWQT